MKTREELERAFVARMERYEREHEQNIAARVQRVIEARKRAPTYDHEPIIRRDIKEYLKHEHASVEQMVRGCYPPERKARYPTGPRCHEWPLHKHHVPQWNAQNGRCYWCCTDMKVTGYHIDHVFPRVRGGSDDPDNLKFTCPTCNLSKNAKLPLDFVLSLFK